MKKVSIAFLLTLASFSVFSQNVLSFNDSLAATFDLLNNKPFTQLSLPDTGGHLFNTASLLGKTVYVDFWFTSCAPCLKEIPYSASLQQFFAADTSIAFVNLCIDNTNKKTAWKQMIRDKKMTGINLFYERDKPQKINLLREYNITFPAYLIVNKQLKVIGCNAPRPSEEGWVNWAIFAAKNNTFLSASFKNLIKHSAAYDRFLHENWQTIVSLRQ